MSSFDYRPVQKTRKGRPLPDGFLSLDEATGKFKVGDGHTAWKDLPWLPLDVSTSPGVQHIAVPIAFDTEDLTPVPRKLTVTIDATGGTFTLVNGPEESDPIDWDTDAASFEAAMDAGFGEGFYSVEGADQVFTITYNATPDNDHELGDNSLTGGASTVDLVPVPAIAGAVVYEPAVGDLLLDAWVELTEPWNHQADAAMFDLGSGDLSYGGFWSASATVNMAGDADTSDYGGTGTIHNTNNQRSLQQASADYGGRVVPAKFVTDDPLVVWVTGDGSPSGSDPGATAGAAIVHLLVLPAP